MTITAKIIADSVSPQGIRLTTMQLRYPKFIHGEFMTHRAFSRNASSSRAIPVERIIQDVVDDPATFVHWGANQAGMQARAELDELTKQQVEFEWFMARDDAVRHAKIMTMYGAHKQLVNRLLEPWLHINVVVTATSYDNFFALRCHPDAQPEIRVLAEAMRDAMEESIPRTMGPGEWHTPYVARGFGQDWPDTIKLSVARCARVSYLTHDAKEPTVEADLALYERLVAAVPAHLSPTEHQATPDRFVGGMSEWEDDHLHGNFHGWVQYRKTLETRS